MTATIETLTNEDVQIAFAAARGGLQVQARNGFFSLVDIYANSRCFGIFDTAEQAEARVYRTMGE